MHVHLRTCRQVDVRLCCGRYRLVAVGGISRLCALRDHVLEVETNDGEGRSLCDGASDLEHVAILGQHSFGEAQLAVHIEIDFRCAQRPNRDRVTVDVGELNIAWEKLEIIPTSAKRRHFRHLEIANGHQGQGARG